MDTPESPAIPEGFNDSTIYIEKLSETYAERFPDAPTSKIADMEAALSEDDLLKVAGDTKRAFAALTTPEPVFNVVKFNTAQEEAIRQQAEQERSVIGKFLGRLFKYDPDVHVQEAKQPINDDPERVDPETLRGTHAVYDNVPPNDTHSRFNAYYEINYEKMREATKNIYNLKPDLEHAMIVYDVLDSAEEADNFIAKYGSTAKCDIVSFNLNKWTLMGPFAQNRDRVNYYDKHSNIIKAMLEQQESDNALAEDLMKNRVKSTKVKAEKVKESVKDQEIKAEQDRNKLRKSAKERFEAMDSAEQSNLVNEFGQTLKGFPLTTFKKTGVSSAMLAPTFATWLASRLQIE
jgi:hypothetical protein